LRASGQLTSDWEGYHISHTCRLREKKVGRVQEFTWVMTTETLHKWGPMEVQ